MTAELESNISSIEKFWFLSLLATERLMEVLLLIYEWLVLGYSREYMVLFIVLGIFDSY